MQESNAKRVVRRMFYRECVGQWLDPHEIENGNILILMGDEPLEIPYIQELGFDPFSVCSVERDEDIFRKQRRMVDGGEIQVSLYFGQMKRYLMKMLHCYKKFVVLNLDVEGSYRFQLDPAMTSVVQFCAANPRTVVATYSSIGRNFNTVWEGIKALTLLVWLAPKKTRQLMASLVHAYTEAGCTQPIRFALRDVFWLVSQIEHLVQASMIKGWISREEYDCFNQGYALLWNYVFTKRKKTLRLRDIYTFVSSWTQIEDENSCLRVLPCMHMGITDLMHVLYRAQRPWIQRCYFTRYEVASPSRRRTVRTHLNRLCDLLISRPFIYVDEDGTRQDIDISSVPECGVDGFIIWKNPQRKQNLYTMFRPRRLRPEKFGHGSHAVESSLGQQ